MKRESPPILGGPSLLVSFAVLLLTLLALLTLTQAQADRRLAEKSAENVRAYYAAELQAQEILARLRSGEQVPGVTASGERWSYECVISEYQTLFVEVNPETWEILRWQANAHPDTPNEDLPVWTGS